MKPEGHTETVSDIKPGHPVWDEIWRRSTPDCQDYASHLTQLLEVSLKYAALQQANEKMREALEMVVNQFEGSIETCNDQDAIDEARAALAEAGGETGI